MARARIAAPVALAAAALAAAAVASGERPRLTIEDPDGCPAIGGSFVALLKPGRGMILLSAAEYLGGYPVGTATGAALRLTIPGGGEMNVARAATAAGRATVWAAIYPFTDRPVAGCVAFDRDRFSSEGDLVTYLRWVVDEVYLAIPAEQRRLYPAFRLSTRQVTLSVAGLGFHPLRLAGREGSTILFRLPGVQRTFLLTPFVLDAARGLVLAQLASTTGEFWQGAAKDRLGVAVAATGEPGRFEDPPITVTVEEISPEP